MKKNSIVSVLLVTFTSLVASAQQVKIEYTNKIDSLSDFMVQYFDLQGVQSYRLKLKGEFNGKRAKIKKVVCNDGLFTEHQLLQDYQHLIMSDSIETLDFMAVPYGKDSIRIACFYPMSYNQKLFEDVLCIDKMKTLMETYTADVNDGTPLMAYTTGIPFNGGTWLCGLRDSGIEPRQWYKKYRIDGYVYYVISLEEDTPPNDNATIYVKIAKNDSYATHIQ